MAYIFHFNIFNPMACTQQNKADKSASNSLNPSIFEGLVTLCAPDAVCFSRHIPHASGRILAERFCVIGTLRSNFLLHKKGWHIHASLGREGKNLYFSYLLYLSALVSVRIIILFFVICIGCFVSVAVSGSVF